MTQNPNIHENPSLQWQNLEFGSFKYFYENYLSSRILPFLWLQFFSILKKTQKLTSTDRSCHSLQAQILIHLMENISSNNRKNNWYIWYMYRFLAGSSSCVTDHLSDKDVESLPSHDTPLSTECHSFSCQWHGLISLVGGCVSPEPSSRWWQM